ncbi:NAD(P)/FAD-dependent oxidoreductase [Marinicella sediminis]|uniref:NAD(P)/FAD-dependent oxidoreductase n=1 Tax=Marinicella sediminis TaxID=1792834 RepID=A0ABV7J773_9GAMM|nr:NAD(P)/FAD-dependent oxidoreductase [Marinicella sediminis]
MSQAKAFDVVVLGAGAAGLMCALTAGQGGCRVLVLEKANKPGKKILMSGGGRCNFTNLHTSPGHFISSNPHFCKSALSRYTPWHFLELINRHEVAYHEKELGQLFCDHSSKDILNLLLDECADGQVDIRLNTDVSELQTGQTIRLDTNHGSFTAKHLVVATGGLSIPKMGGSDFGYQLAMQLGLTVLPRRAGLVPLVFTDQYKGLFAELSGTAITVSVQVPENKTAPGFHHQLLFTHRGLSGPAMLQISSYWSSGQVLEINLLPGVDAASDLSICKSNTPACLLHQWLAGYLPKKAAHAILAHEFPAWHDLPLQNLTAQQLQQVASTLNRWCLKPSGTEGYRTAEVTLGGVDTHAVSSQTMACLQQSNVYFVGEVLDVTGHLGGFNFQWAWASGFAAAKAIGQLVEGAH